MQDKIFQVFLSFFTLKNRKNFEGTESEEIIIKFFGNVGFF